MLSKTVPKATDQENKNKHSPKPKSPPDDVYALQDETSLSTNDFAPSPAMEVSSHETEGASAEEAHSPEVVDISDEDTSMEVEIKIVQETTPIYKQHTPFVSGLHSL